MADRIDMAGTVDCKHFSADRVDKEIEALEIGHRDETDDFRKRYLVADAADLAAEAATAYQVLYGGYTYRTILPSYSPCLL